MKHLFKGRAAPGGVFHPHAVVGHLDTRTQVINQTTAPWSSIGRLSIDAGHISNAVGTGFFIAPQMMLTAAHCLYDNTLLNGRASRITIAAPSTNNDRDHITIDDAARFHTPLFWNGDTDDVQHDYGIIDLRGTDFVARSYFEFSSKSDFSGFLANIAGFPSDLSHSKAMYHDAGIIDEVFMGIVRYKTDTGTGQSGGPIWYYEDPNETVGKVIGIHVQHGDHFTIEGARKIFVDNVGVAIGDEVRTFIADIEMS